MGGDLHRWLRQIGHDGRSEQSATDRWRFLVAGYRPASTLYGVAFGVSQPKAVVASPHLLASGVSSFPALGHAAAAAGSVSAVGSWPIAFVNTFTASLGTRVRIMPASTTRATSGLIGLVASTGAPTALSTSLWVSALPAPPPAPSSAEGPTPPMSPPQHDALAARAPTRHPARQHAPAPDHPGTAIIAESAAWYDAQLRDSPDAADARAYLRSRGITEDLWDTWQLGWAPDQWQALTGHLAATGADLDDAVDSGVIGNTRGRYWDFLRGRVVFPIKDAAGTVIALAGDGPKYLNTPNTDLYNKSSALYGIDRAGDAIARTGEAVLVEGYTDAITCPTAGVPNAVAACGTAFGPDHIYTLCNHAGRPGLLTIALDGDDAGAKAATTAAEIAADYDISHRIVQLPDGTDPAELEPDELRHIIRTTTPPPWSHLPALAANPSITSRYKAGYAATQASHHGEIAAIIAAHEIANAADLAIQSLLDEALKTARTAGRPELAPSASTPPASAFDPRAATQMWPSSTRALSKAGLGESSTTRASLSAGTGSCRSSEANKLESRQHSWEPSESHSIASNPEMATTASCRSSTVISSPTRRAPLIRGSSKPTIRHPADGRDRTVNRRTRACDTETEALDHMSQGPQQPQPMA